MDNHNLQVKVTRINDRWHARVLSSEGVILDEMACEAQQDIGWICREMLRWQDKCGRTDDFTSAARHRQLRGPHGKVWYRPHLRN